MKEKSFFNSSYVIYCLPLLSSYRETQTCHSQFPSFVVFSCKGSEMDNRIGVNPLSLHLHLS